jgi:hypothetical protein
MVRWVTAFYGSRGAWKVDENGEVVGGFLPNPAFKPS